MSKKILTILGARPQFVKSSVLSKALKNYPGVREVMVHTGQHYDYSMSGSFFEELGLPEPEYNLEVREATNELALAAMLKALKAVFTKEQPDLVIVYGDTNSTLAGALSARFHRTPLVHIEAGMRIGNLNMPEELNRVITDRLSDLLFCSSQEAISNLEKEGYRDFPCQIFFSGDVMYDSFLQSEAKATDRKFLLTEEIKGKYVLASLHRAETVDNEVRLREVITVLNSIAKSVSLVMPIHPRTLKRIKEFQIPVEFQLLDPVSYPDMINLIRHCKLVMTDSGGLQKEAFFLKKGCVVLREQTEWKELENHGYLFVAGIDAKQISKAYEKVSQTQMSFKEKFYGDGHAGEMIAKEIVGFLQANKS